MTTKTAILSFNKETAMWEAIYAGNVLSASTNKSYIRINIESGKNKKAELLGVTKCEEASVAAVKTEENAPELVEFDINERFTFLSDYVDMVSTRDIKSAIVVGQGGLGKSYTVFRQLARNNMVDVTTAETDEEDGSYSVSENSKKEYVVVKGYSTAKGLFRTLFENRNRLVVFDDCDSILGNETSSNLLKAALDSYDRRIVTWNAESFGSESDLPKSFEFKGAVVFISNLSMTKIPQAIVSRAATADVTMTREEIVTRMRQIVAEGEFMEDVSMEIKNEALDFIEANIDNQQIKTINLRTLIAVVTNRRCKPTNWERLSLSMMMSAR